MDSAGSGREGGDVERTKDKTRSRLVVLLGALGALAIVLAAAGVVLLFSHARFKQPSGSMWPTFEVGTTFTADRFDRKPARGAVIVFKFPERPEQLFDKRVIAMPGDKLEVRGQTVLLNGWEVPKCRVGTASYAEAGEGTVHTGELFVEWLGAAVYLVFHDADGLSASEQGPYHAKPGEHLVLGDNRNNSHDSRMWWGGQGGGVPEANVVGRARTPDVPALPPGSEGLRGALDACLAKKPAQTEPPPP
ncbi:MAG: signal peptidase I [Labilithrix sp.]|nr:signal peptidase I [Labilithrix sp.]